MARIRMKREPIALLPETADLLISRGSGDAALLYLYLLRKHGEYDPATAKTDLNWTTAQVVSAFTHLTELGLVDDPTPEERKNAPQAEECPHYTSEDINSELAADGSDFKALLTEMEHLLGKTFSATDLRILLELYDHLAMPAEVLIELTAWQIEETEGKYGPGRRPRMGEVKAAAYRWKKNGIDTLEDAESYIKKQTYFKGREGELLQAVGITNRSAIEGERRFLHQWTEWGFGPDAVRMAYERTVLRVGGMKWPYCNGILRRWNDKNAHTVEEIQALEKNSSRSVLNPQPTGHAGAGQQPVQVPSTARQNAAWMQRMLEEEDN